MSRHFCSSEECWISEVRLTFVRSAMDEAPEKDRDDKPAILRTDDEIMDELFGPEVRKELKRLAHEKRPEEEETECPDL